MLQRRFNVRFIERCATGSVEDVSGCIDSLQISNRRVIVWTGSRVTTHNLRILLHYVKVAKPSSPSC